MVNRTFQHLSWGVAFCFICLWSTYITFENYTESERQKEAYEDQLRIARERMEQAISEADELRKTRDVSTDTNLRRLRQLETQHKSLLEEYRALQKEQSSQERRERQERQEQAPPSPLVGDKAEAPKNQDTDSSAESLRSKCQALIATEGSRAGQLSDSDTTPAKRAKHSLDIAALSSNTSIIKYHIISHTHWDREWYLPFEQFRGRLVKLLDDVIGKLDTDPTFQHFHLDGQLIPAEDYIEIREHMKDKIKLANLHNKVALGPWYVQPDEFLVTAESLVRNLMLGIRKAEEMGGSSLVGYIPDSFGHIAQMPQLLLGFDIESAVSGRGPDNKQPSELWWQGPDGSRILFIFLRKWYCNGMDMPSVANSLIPWYQKKTKELVTAGAKTSHLLILNGCDHTAPDPNVGVQIVESNRKFQQLGEPRIAIHSNLDDYVHLVHDEVQRNQIALTKWSGEMRLAIDHLANTLSTKITQKMMNWRVSTLFEKWMEPLEALAWKLQGRKYDRDRIWYAWKVLLENHPHDSICSCSVSEVHQEVDTRYAKARQTGEQLANVALAQLMHSFIEPHVLADGYRRLFVFNPSNFPREREVIYAEIDLRAEKQMALQCFDTNGKISNLHVLEIASKVWTYELPDTGFRKAYTKDVIRMALEVSVPAHGYNIYTCQWVNQGESMRSNPLIEKMIEEAKARESKEKLRRADYHGEGDDDEDQAENGENKDDKEEAKDGQDDQSTAGSDSPDSRSLLDAKPAADPRARGRLRRLPAIDLLPTLYPSATPIYPDWHSRNMLGEDLLKEAVMENEHLQARIERSGQLTIVHKASQLEFTSLNRLEESPDNGDEYVFKRRGTTGLMYSSADNTRVVLVKHYITHSVIQTRTNFGTDVAVMTTYILAQGSHRVDVRAVIENQKNNHRVRAQFWTQSVAANVYADSQYEVIKRITTVKYHPQLKYLMAYDLERRQGIAIANKGLPEYNVENNYLSITLLRAVDKLGDWGKFPTPTAQEHGNIAVEYSIIPFVNPLNIEQFPFIVPDAEARKFNERVVAINAKHYPGYFPDALIDPGFSELQAFSRPSALRSADGRTMRTSETKERHLPAEQSSEIMPGSLFEVRPRHFVVSTLKKAEDRDSLILRFYNPFDITETAHVYVSSRIKFKHAYRCELSELRRGDGPLDLEENADGSRLIKIVVTPKKVVTIELE